MVNSLCVKMRNVLMVAPTAALRKYDCNSVYMREFKLNFINLSFEACAISVFAVIQFSCQKLSVLPNAI